MIEIKAYKCEHCMKKVYQSKSSANKHEKQCWWNTEVKACMTCVNYMQPDDMTKFKIINGDNTVCIYTDEDTGFNSKCSGWRLY
jgi:hypothetical protein